MGRHVWFRTPTKHDRLDIIDLYINKVSHDPELDMPRRRDEIARVTNGYSPAMIEQVTSMALTIAHHSGRERFSWDDLVESITTLESGTAIGIEYVEREGRAIAIHEAGHAIAGHAFMKDFESTRLSIRRRGDSGGHHQAREKEERFARFQSEMFAQLIWGLGAMAAERVFYNENSTGVGGDVQSVTAQTAGMVGAAAMGPQPFVATPKDGETEEEARRRALERLEGIGLQIMNRMGGGGPMAPDPISAALSDPSKRRAGAQIIGQAYVIAHNLATTNREALDKIADVLIARKEIFGDELVDLLDSVGIRIPDLDYSDDAIWPPPFFTISSRRAPAAEGAQGRMSENVEQGGPVIEAPLATPVADADATPREERARLSGYRRRFAFIYIALALIAGVGLGALIVLVSRPDSGPAPVWSAWVPNGSETARVRQIADHVAKGYRNPEGEQLVVALAGPPTVTAGGGETTNPIPIRAIAVRPDTSTGQAEEDDIEIHRRLEQHAVLPLRAR